MKFEKTPWNVMFRALKNLKVMGGDAFGGQNKLKSSTLRIFPFFVCKSAITDSATLPCVLACVLQLAMKGWTIKCFVREGWVWRECTEKVWECLSMRPHLSRPVKAIRVQMCASMS